LVLAQGCDESCVVPTNLVIVFTVGQRGQLDIEIEGCPNGVTAGFAGDVITSGGTTTTLTGDTFSCTGLNNAQSGPFVASGEMERQSGFDNNNFNNENNHRNGPGGKTMNSDGSWSDNRDNNSGENNNDENNDRCENFERFLTGFNLDNSKTCVRNQNTNGPCGFPGGANVCDTEADEEECNQSFGGDDSTTCAECEGGLCVPEEEREQGCFCDDDDDCADAARSLARVTATDVLDAVRVLFAVVLAGLARAAARNRHDSTALAIRSARAREAVGVAAVSRRVAFLRLARLVTVG
jgi:hypothetical protein